MTIGSVLVFELAFAQQPSLGLESFSTQKQSSASYQRLSPKSFDSFFSYEDEKALEEVTDIGIEQMSRLIEQFERSPNRGELWLRLAELYIEKSKIVSLKEQREYQENYERYEKNPQGRPPKESNKRSRVYITKAAKLYRRFVKEFRKDPKVDQALFFLGYTFFELDKIKKGVEYYDELVKRFPKSPYILEANFAIAEYYFERRDWQRALESYREVAKNRAARFYIFALYKSGWCFYRLGKVDRALQVMERVLIEGRRIQKKEKKAGGKRLDRLRLASEAMRDLIPFYADSGRDFRRAFNYFGNIGGEKQTNQLVERLAYYYSDSGKKEAARYLFKELIKRNFNSPKSFEYQYQIVINYMASGKDQIFREELRKWVKNFSKDSRWYRQNQNNKRMLKDAERVREATLRNFVLQVHQTAKNSRQTYSQNVAIDGYKFYLNSFPNSDKASLMHFYYGELLFDMKKYGQAAKEYLWVIQNDPQSGYAEPSMINSVIALEKQLPSDQAIMAKVGKRTERVPFSPQIKSFVQAGELYLQNFPKGDRRDRVRFKIARLHYLHNHFEEALVGFKRVVKDSPKSKLGEYSANLILDIYKLRKDFKGLAKAGKSLMGANVSPKVEKDIKNIVEATSFKEAEELEKSGRFTDSAASFLNFAKANPLSILAATAVFNAGVNYSRGGEALKSIAVLAPLSQRKKRGTSPKLVKQSKLKLVELYLQTAQFEKAAFTYEELAQDNPRDSNRQDYSYNAAVIWDDLAQWDSAVKNYEAYYRVSKEQKRSEALFAIAKISEKRGYVRGTLKAYQRYLASAPFSPENAIEAQFKVANYESRLGMKTESVQSYWKTIAMQKKYSKGRVYGLKYAAESRFLLALPAYNEFISMKLSKNPARQAKSLSDKLSKMEQIKKEMAEVVLFGDPNHIVAAFTVLGKANLHLNRFLKNAPLPAGLNDKEKEEYQRQLENTAAPFLRSSIDNFEKALENSQKFESYNRWVDLAKEGLASIDSKKYAFSGEPIITESEIDWMGI